MRSKTSELTGTALDWAVAKCEGHPVHDPNWENRFLDAYAFSTDWATGGPIIEREKIRLTYIEGLQEWEAWVPVSADSMEEYSEASPTPLVAAMRCYVASTLGDEVDVPEELK